MKFLRSDITFSQNLALDELDYTTDVYTHGFKLEQIIVQASENIVESITISVDSAKGSSYDHVLASIDLNNERSYVYKPEGEANYQKGDKIRVQCTNANTTGIVSGLIKTSQLR